MKMSSAIDALSALAHRGRLSAFRLLVKTGPKGLAAGEIARKLSTPASSLSANLNILSHARLVEARRDGRSIIYTANYGAMGDLLAYLMEDCCGGRPEVCAPVMNIAAACCSPTDQASRGASR
jgi:DNA-binding transcriptional ArsR family regulator